MPDQIIGWLGFESMDASMRRPVVLNLRSECAEILVPLGPADDPYWEWFPFSSGRSEEAFDAIPGYLWVEDAQSSDVYHACGVQWSGVQRIGLERGCGTLRCRSVAKGARGGRYDLLNGVKTCGASYYQWMHRGARSKASKRYPDGLAAEGFRNRECT